MEKRLFGLFSGGHVAAMVCVAMLVPGALFAAVTFSNVAVVNPTSGVPAFVDAAGRFSVLDSIAYYRNFPGNMVDIFTSNDVDNCETLYQYAVPAGKAFIITGMSGDTYQYNSATGYSGVAIYAGVGCSGHLLTTLFTTPATGLLYSPIVADYGVGIPVPAGSTISVKSYNNFGYTFLHGYLVPAATVGASSYSPNFAAAAQETVAGKLSRMAR